MLIKNCRVLAESGELVLKDILIKDGKIVEINDKIDRLNEEILDISGKIVIPGCIDVHTHMREPGLTSKEDLESGSKACVKGGVTTFLDMPNTVPNTITEKELNEKERLAQNRCYCDYGFHFGGSRFENSKEIERVKDRVATTKIFLNMSTGDMLVESEEILSKIFKSSKFVSVHSEGEMVQKAIELSKRYDTPLYLCHISTAEELEIIKKAKKEGAKIYVEVAPHHLVFTEENRDNFLRMKPELKSKSDCEALWRGIDEGVIDTIGTDHAPHTVLEKEKKIIFGVPSVENYLEILLKEVKNKRISLKKLVELTSLNPAKIFKIKGKNGLNIGSDADLVVIDLDKEYVVKRKDIVSKSGWSPYENMQTGGTVETTIVRGEIVYHKGEFYNKIGKGVSYYE